MKYLKEVPRRFRNNFRCENVYKKALPEKPESKEKGDGKINYAKIPRRKLH